MEILSNGEDLSEKVAKIDERIKEFKDNIFKEFEVNVEVLYNIIDHRKKLPLSTLVNIINECLFRRYDKDKYPKGIRTRTRKRKVVIYRDCYMSIAYNWCYSLNQIGYEIGYDHATVLHARKTLSSMIKTNFKEGVEIYKEVIYEIRKQYGIDGTVPFDHKTRSEPESVLLTLCPKGNSTNF